MQGDGAASPGFLLIAIILVRSLYSRGLTADMITPILRVVFKLAGQIFVDDADLNIMNNGCESEEAVLDWAQRILDTWHKNFQHTGGDLKAHKCYWTMRSYCW